MTPQEKSYLLRRNPLFKGLDGNDLDHLASLATSRPLKREETLFVKGDEGNALYGLISGRIKISSAAPSGREIILNVLEPGAWFGEIALLDGRPRTADASASVDSTLLVLNRRDFLPFLENHPKLALQLLELLCARMRWTNSLLEDASFLSLEGRLAKRLLALAEAQKGEGSNLKGVIIQQSQSDIGQMLNASRESVNKLLQGWMRNGWIGLGRSKIEIISPGHLAEVVEMDEPD